MENKINETYFFEVFALMYLFKKRRVSTDRIEKIWGSIFGDDKQNVNNIISNRSNSTSVISKGWLEYDEKKHILKITKDGKNVIKEWFGRRRGEKKGKK